MRSATSHRVMLDFVYPQRISVCSFKLGLPTSMEDSSQTAERELVQCRSSEGSGVFFFRFPSFCFVRSFLPLLFRPRVFLGADA